MGCAAMPRLKYLDPSDGEYKELVLAGSVGPPGPSVVSADADNAAELGTDSFIFVPDLKPYVDSRVPVVGTVPPEEPVVDQLWVDTN